MKSTSMDWVGCKMVRLAPTVPATTLIDRRAGILKHWDLNFELAGVLVEAAAEAFARSPPTEGDHGVGRQLASAAGRRLTGCGPEGPNPLARSRRDWPATAPPWGPEAGIAGGADGSSIGAIWMRAGLLAPPGGARHLGEPGCTSYGTCAITTPG
jgi:hypothetical protein